MKRFWFLLSLVLVITLAWSWNSRQYSSQSANAVTPSVQNLSIGVNVAHWFENPLTPDFTKEQLDTWMTEGEFKTLSDLGATHIRLPIQPDFLQGKSAPYASLPERFAYVDRAISWAQKYRLSIVLDIHPVPKLNLDRGTRSPDYDRLQKVWAALADRYRSQPETVFYEILNEPQVKNPRVWREIAQGLVNTIRKVDTRHTLVISGPNWGGPEDLPNMVPVKDDKVVYSFHFYEPMPFTHQGAGWAGDLQLLRDIPYPYDAAKFAVVKQKIRNPKADFFLNYYEKHKYNKARLALDLKPALAFRDRYHVPLYCGEFGVHRVAPRPDRLRWYQDVADLLQSANIGRAAWEYRGNFGVVSEDGKERDQALFEAIGL